MFSRGVYRNSLAVEGAAEGLAALKELDGVRLVVVTARGEDARETSQRWLNEHFPGVFDELYFTGALYVYLPRVHASIAFPHRC
jgi:hypothetical protein